MTMGSTSSGTLNTLPSKVVRPRAWGSSLRRRPSPTRSVMSRATPSMAYPGTCGYSMVATSGALPARAALLSLA